MTPRTHHLIAAATLLLLVKLPSGQRVGERLLVEGVTRFLLKPKRKADARKPEQISKEALQWP